ncbi:hypothetical protein ACIN5109_0057 [Acinetobacter baumannii OIFC109]|nr:hypothetical protein ACIN5109_0057 [Acinetobacter baumannii OIFC109]
MTNFAYLELGNFRPNATTLASLIVVSLIYKDFYDLNF